MRIRTWNRRWPILAALAALGLAVGCAQRDYEAAQETNTLEAYEEYLKDHPESEQAAEARRKVQQLREQKDLDRLETVPSSKVYEAFLEKYPQSERRSEIEQKLEDLVFQEATYRFERSHKIAGHTARVFAVRYSPDGARIVSSGSDLDVKIRNAVTGALENTIYVPNQKAVQALAFFPDGRSLLGGSDRVHHWSLQSTEILGQVRSNEREVLSLAVHPRGVTAVAGNNANAGNLDVYDVGNYYLIETLAGHTLEVTAVEYNTAGDRFYSGSADRTIIEWDSAEYKPIRTFKLKDKINGLAVSPDGTRIYFGGRGNNEVGYVDLETGKTAVMGNHKQSANDVAISGDGKYLVSVGEDKTVWLWDTAAGRRLDEWTTEGPVWRVEFAPRDRAFVVAEENQNIYLFTKRTTEYLNGYAARHIEAGRMDKAKAFLERARSEKMLDSQGYLMLGRVAAIQQRYDEAIGHFQTAAKVRKDNPEVLLELAKAYESRNGQGDRTRAAQTYKKIYDLDARSREGGRAKEALDRLLGAGWDQAK